MSRVRDNPAPYAWSGYVDVSRAYTVNGLNQYTGAASATGSATFGYDANGNLVSDGTRGFTYDAENRLVQTAAGAELTYDALGRLYKVATATGSETYLYEGDQRIAEYDASGTMTARYVPGAGGDNPLFWYDGSATTNPRALQGDERGSIVSVVDGSGTILGYNSYDEYGIPGNVRDTTGKIAAFTNIGRYQYTGQLWVPQLNLYYYKARFYSPFLGRFMQTDPIGYADQNNLYAYVGNDPMDETDPTGLFGLLGGCPPGSACSSTNAAASNAADHYGASTNQAANQTTPSSQKNTLGAQRPPTDAQLIASGQRAEQKDDKGNRERPATDLEKGAGNRYARRLISELQNCRGGAQCKAASDRYYSYMASPLMLAVRNDNVKRHNFAFGLWSKAWSFVGGGVIVSGGKAAIGFLGGLIGVAYGSDPIKAKSPYEPQDK